MMGKDKDENKELKRGIEGVSYDHLSARDRAELDDEWKDDPFERLEKWMEKKRAAEKPCK